MWRELREPWGSSDARPGWMKPVGSGDSTFEHEGGGRTRELELTRDSSAPRSARRWVDEHFSDPLGDDKLAIAQLLISELVTNALVHGVGTILLRAGLNRRQLVAEVIDKGPGFEWSAPEPDLERARGWGLVVVAGGSDRWGIREGASHVWFELNL